MQYFRKVNCPKLNIQATFEDQAKAVRLFTKLKDMGFHDSELLDYKVEEDVKVKLDDDKFEKIIKKVK